MHRHGDPTEIGKEDSPTGKEEDPVVFAVFSDAQLNAIMNAGNALHECTALCLLASSYVFFLLQESSVWGNAQHLSPQYLVRLLHKQPYNSNNGWMHYFW